MRAFRAFFPLPRQSQVEFGCDIFPAWNPKAVSRVEIFISLSEASRFIALEFVFALFWTLLSTDLLGCFLDTGKGTDVQLFRG